MAETFSYFVINPDRLRARSMAKYEFVRDRIMQGDIYVARIREDLTFEVYNLFPDYVYPGKIRAIDITVEGAPHEDKKITVVVQLHTLDEVMEGAHRGQTRISSESRYLFRPVALPRRRVRRESSRRRLGAEHPSARRENHFEVRQGWLLAVRGD